MPNIFNSIKLPHLRSNVFNLSHDVKMSFKMGQLVPSCVMDVLPGDKVKINVENMLRFAPLVSPVMHRINVTTHYYFVPNRLLWSNWEKFITGDEDLEHPYFFASVVPNASSLMSYLGYPHDIPADMKLNLFPLVAYLLIHDEYYRDQNLQTTRKFLGTFDGNNSGTYSNDAAGEVLRRAWQHDYFTSCLPFAQKGDAVEIPLLANDRIPVTLSGTNQAGLVRDADDGGLVTGANVTLRHNNGTFRAGTVADDDAFYDPNDTLEVVTTGEASTINTLRRAFRLQEWLERNARGGTRYIESILAHFGVRSSDHRLQRPEYLGGGYQTMAISEVLSTAQTDPSGSQEFPVGYLAGHGISAGGSREFSYRAEEHGWIIGLINVQPVTGYWQGVPRSHRRLDKFDYYWPSFANIGEQTVLNSEIYVDALQGSATYDGTFGYIPRYSEYKYQANRVCGEMRDTLKFWHLNREFSTPPALNEDFIVCDPSDRIFAATDEEHVYAHIFNRVRSVRKMPKFAVPSI